MVGCNWCWYNSFLFSSLVCIGFRAILLPFSIKSSKQAMKMQEIQPELNSLMERARLSQSMGLASDAQRIRDEMMVIDNSRHDD